MSQQGIELTINGQMVRAAPGQSVLQAAALAGLRLPMMCFNRLLPAEEACRLCIVEVEGQPRPLAACATPVTPGLRVRTDSPALREQRQAIFRLLLDDHYGDCLAPCSQRCPANIDIQGYIALVARGQFLEATRLIRQTNPLPLTCGRVCPHPCEAQCRRGRVDQPIAINHLKRLASDIAYQEIERLNPAPASPSGLWVALVGGGPASLSAAYFLALLGHSPVIFEAMPKLGGMLRYGIPQYRLPKEVLDREIEAVLRLGVQARTGLAWGRDFTLQGLLDQGFAALFLGIGAWINSRMGLEGEDAQGVWPGTGFLNQVALGGVTSLAGQRVAVIGGGNTAMDCARSALRLGAAGVTIYYRRSRQEMPAQALEVDEAQREGVVLEMCTAPAALLTSGGRLEGMILQAMELCELDASGRAQPRPLAGSERRVDLDCLMVAIGQQPDLGLFKQDALASGLELRKGRAVQGAYLTGATNLERVFVGGDLVSGPATVVEAIGAGRRAAQAMDRWLRGRPLEPARHFTFSRGTLHEVDQGFFEGRVLAPRAPMPELGPGMRAGNFAEVELGLSEEAGRAEALRCLSCGCMAFAECRIRQVGDLIGLRELVTGASPSQGHGLMEDHPHIVVDDNKCVVCRACQRACQHYHGRDAVQVQVERVGDLAQERPHRTRFNERCDHCGLCLALCPTGALSHKTPYAKPGPFPLVWAESHCGLCAVGCGLRLGKVGEHVARVDGAAGAPNFGHLCVRGRFELIELAHGPGRLRAPLLRAHGQARPASWEEALAETVGRFQRLRQAHGPESLAVLCLGQATLEELYLLGKLARLGLGNNHMALLDPARADQPAGLPGLPAPPPYEEIEGLEMVALVGGGLARAYRLLEPALHRLRAKGGQVLLAAPADDGLAGQADLRLDLAPAPALEMLADLAQGRGQASLAAEMWATANSRLVLVGEVCLGPPALEAWRRLVAALAGQAGARLGVLPALAAGPAARAAGFGPACLPGGRPLSPFGWAALERTWGASLPHDPGLDGAGILAAAQAGRLKGLLVLGAPLAPGEDVAPGLLEAAAKVEFLALLTSQEGALCRLAHVALPRLLEMEKDGTLLDAAGRRQALAVAARPAPGMRPELEVLAALLQGLAGQSQASQPRQVRAELEGLI
ncbi:MAG: FAD-dependent oxidoreductase [Desulfarculus sp.]|nr:FAD-dependent oxidoreductase [Desulfarculus sp.]